MDDDKKADFELTSIGVAVPGEPAKWYDKMGLVFGPDGQPVSQPFEFRLADSDPPHRHQFWPAEKCEICLLRADLVKANARISEIERIVEKFVDLIAKKLEKP